MDDPKTPVEDQNDEVVAAEEGNEDVELTVDDVVTGGENTPSSDAAEGAEGEDDDVSAGAEDDEDDEVPAPESDEEPGAEAGSEAADGEDDEDDEDGEVKTA